MVWTASHRFARIGPRKVRLVADLIRGQQVNEAMEILRFASKRASVFVDKVLRSAVANADEQEGNVERLYVLDAHVDAGPTFRRWRPKDRGRAHPIDKGTSHIVVTVEEIGAGGVGEASSAPEAVRG